MAIYISPQGNPEIWEKKPRGYFTQEEWKKNPNASDIEFSSDPSWEKRNGSWWKIRLNKKDFLALCGFEIISNINTAIAAGNAIATTAYDFLMSEDIIDLTNEHTINLIKILASPQAGEILLQTDIERILSGEEAINSLPGGDECESKILQQKKTALTNVFENEKNKKEAGDLL